MYDIVTNEYLPENTWRDIAKQYDLTKYCVELLGVFDHPTYEQVADIAMTNKFLLSQAENVGEGVVCKVPGWKNKYGQTPLHAAVFTGNIPIIELLLKNKADISAVDVNELTPYHYAYINENQDVVNAIHETLNVQ